MKKILLLVVALATFLTADLIEGRTYECNGTSTVTKKDYVYTMSIVTPETILIGDFLFSYKEESKVYVALMGSKEIILGLFPKKNKIRLFNFRMDMSCKEK